MIREVVFIDTSALYAIADKYDENHKQAVDIYQNILNRDVRVVITDHILAETATLIRRRLGYRESIEFLNRVEEGIAVELFELLFPDKPIIQQAKIYFQELKDPKISFVDCLSFATMKSKNIDRFFAFDMHFTSCGFLPYKP